MPNGQLRVLAAVLCLVVGGVLGCASTGGGFKKIVKHGTHAVVVGPKADQITIDELHLSKNGADVAFWAAKEKGKKLYIEFQVEVFEGMTQANGRFRVQCTGRHCYSDEIKVPYYEGDQKRNTYKYWQILDDGTNQDVADGIIIIDP